MDNQISSDNLERKHSISDSAVTYRFEEAVADRIQEIESKISQIDSRIYSTQDLMDNVVKLSTSNTIDQTDIISNFNSVKQSYEESLSRMQNQLAKLENALHQERVDSKSMLDNVKSQLTMLENTIKQERESSAQRIQESDQLRQELMTIIDDLKKKQIMLVSPSPSPRKPGQSAQSSTPASTLKSKKNSLKSNKLIDTLKKSNALTKSDAKDH
jgi:flagellar biosynthesis chaperone FliJ